MKKLLKSNIIAAVLVVSTSVLCAVFVPGVVYAECAEGQQEISLSVDGTTTCVDINEGGSLEENPIYVYVRGILVFLAGGVGIAVVGGIVFGAYLYMTARGNAAQTQKGQTVILNSVIGLLMFIFMYAILQFIIPGGIFQ